jgi:hypothetical protein
MEKFLRDYHDQIAANKHRAEIARRKRVEQRRVRGGCIATAGQRRVCVTCLCFYCTHPTT